MILPAWRPALCMRVSVGSACDLRWGTPPFVFPFVSSLFCLRVTFYSASGHPFTLPPGLRFLEVLVLHRRGIPDPCFPDLHASLVTFVVTRFSARSVRRRFLFVALELCLLLVLSLRFLLQSTAL